MAMIDEEDCPVCEPFDQGWIFTYSDLVTLLLCFFILLFSMCKMDIEKFRDTAQSFKPTPAGSPYLLDGNDAIVRNIKQQLEASELADNTSISVEERGTVISFNAKALFQSGEMTLTEKAKKDLARFSKILYMLPNDLVVAGHADSQETGNLSRWALSGLRASAVAKFLIQEGVEKEKIQIIGYGEFRPAFTGEIEEQRALNSRVEVTIK